MGTDEDVLQFTEAWQRDGPRIAAYARRHVDAEEVADVVSETFLHAWRRWAEVPQPPLPWLIGTARKVVSNKWRGNARRQSLEHRLRQLGDLALPAVDAGVVAADRAAALSVLASLSDRHREALLLVAWDGLTPDEAAAALGVRPATFRVRLHRARAAVRAAFAAAEADPSPRLTSASLLKGTS